MNEHDPPKRPLLCRIVDSKAKEQNSDDTDKVKPAGFCMATPGRLDRFDAYARKIQDGSHFQLLQPRDFLIAYADGYHERAVICIK